MKCAHKHTRFLACSAADRFPGKFVCDDCDDTFSFDPSGKVKVRYLGEPNKKATKVIDLKSSGA